MNKQAYETYLMILETQNGFSKQEINLLSWGEIECDPLYQKIEKIVLSYKEEKVNKE